MPPAILPPIFVGGGRPGGECASGLPPIGPRRVAIFRKGDAAGNPHPKFYSVVVVQGEDAPPVLFPLNLVAWPSLGKGTPPAILPQKNSVVVVLRVVLREEEPPLLPPNLVTWPSSGRRTSPAIPPPNIYGVVVVRGEDASPVLLPPNLVAWPSSGRGTPTVRRQDAPPALLLPNLAPWPFPGRETPMAILPPNLFAWR